MTETEKLYIKSARMSLFDKKYQDALDFYLQANKENKDNAEAAYWVYKAYWASCIDDEDKSITDKVTAFYAVSTELVNSIDQIAESEGSIAEKNLVMLEFLFSYMPIADYAIQARIATQSMLEFVGLTYYRVGNAIENAFGSDENSISLACDAWKEGVKIQRKYYAYSYEGNNADDYIRKIKKIEPDYTAPQKAGCVSIG